MDTGKAEKDFCHLVHVKIMITIFTDKKIKSDLNGPKLLFIILNNADH